jgi:hypothetical protein
VIQLYKLLLQNYRQTNKMFKFLKIFLVASTMMLILLSTLNVNVIAQEAVSAKCNAVTESKKITFSSLFDLSNFLPLIPESCGIDSNEGVNPLPFFLIFDIIIRTAGFLFSLAFYILPIAVIVYGARVLFVSFDPGLNKSDFTQATTIGRTITRDLSQFLTGIIVIVFSYTLVFTILQTLQINITGNSSEPLTTDLRGFFSTK